MNDTIYIVNNFDENFCFIGNKIDTLNHTIIQTLKSKPTPVNEIFGMPESVARILIPALITIAIFLFTQLLAWLKRKFDKQREIKDYRSLFLKWINLIEPSVRLQINSCLDFSSRVVISKNIEPEILQYNKLLADKIESFSVDKYIQAFVINSTGDKEENYKGTVNLISQFNYLKNIETEIKDLYNTYHKQTFEIMDEWNANFKKLDELISLETKKFRTDEKYLFKEFHTNVVKLTQDWTKNASNGRSTVSETIEKLVLPLIELSNQEFYNHPENDYVFDLLERLQNLKMTHLKWSVNIKGNSAVFKNIGDNMNKSYESLIKSGEYFKTKTKIVKFWRIN